MPWITLPHPITVSGVRFTPISAKDPAQVVGPEIAETVAQVLRLYVDRSGSPIESCTIILRPRHLQAWNIPDKMWKQAGRAAEVLALACLAEQRFLMGHLSPHLNASMFSLVGQGIKAGSDGITLSYPRRGNGLRVWTRSGSVRFQAPRQIDGTECEIIGTRLTKALIKAYRTNDAIWEPIASSLEFFLLGHAETHELSWNSCIMLSAMAFERPLERHSGEHRG
jgi:hypothetical protein